MKSFLQILAAASLAAILSGCGGLGIKNLGLTQSLYAGNYQGAYTRLDGSVSVSVPEVGNLAVSVTDGGLTTYTGTGQLQDNGSFEITAKQGNLEIVVSGDFHGVSSATYCNISITGQFSAATIATKQ